jgi:hypothetical protein
MKRLLTECALFLAVAPASAQPNANNISPPDISFAPEYGGRRRL